MRMSNCGLISLKTYVSQIAVFVKRNSYASMHAK